MRARSRAARKRRRAIVLCPGGDLTHHHCRVDVVFIGDPRQGARPEWSRLPFRQAYVYAWESMKPLRRLSKSQELSGAPVLIVEDDDALRVALQEVVEQAGYEVAIATSIVAARALLATVRPVAVVLAMRIGGDSSAAFLAELSGHVNPQTTIAISGSDAANALASEYGVLSVMKPFDIDALVDTLRRALCEGPQLLATSQRRRSEPAREPE